MVRGVDSKLGTDE
jgi:hypothetical protein